MRGVVLAGGTGSRFGDLTRAVNKHLLPVHDRPMIMWAIKVLRDNNIDDITIVSSPHGISQLVHVLGSSYTYKVQDKPGGLAHAILQAKSKSTESVAVVLGDNVFLPSPLFGPFTGLAHIHLCGVADPRPFGIAEFGPDSTIARVIEKPLNSTSNMAVTGLYLFNNRVFDGLLNLRPSARGELEITDYLDVLAKSGNLSASAVPGFWGDAGTFPSLAECALACKEYNSCGY